MADTYFTNYIQEPKLVLHKSKLVVPPDLRDFYWEDLTLEEGDIVDVENSNLVFYPSEVMDDACSKDGGLFTVHRQTRAIEVFDKCSLMYLGMKVQIKCFTTLEIISFYKFLFLDTQKLVWFRPGPLGDSISLSSRSLFFKNNPPSSGPFKSSSCPENQ